jgi:hypothetical protein
VQLYGQGEKIRVGVLLGRNAALSHGNNISHSQTFRLSLQNPTGEAALALLHRCRFVNGIGTFLGLSPMLGVSHSQTFRSGLQNPTGE